LQWAMLGAVVLPLGVGIVLGRVQGPWGAQALGSVAGPAFGLAYRSALQRRSVTQATAPLVVAETVVPASLSLGVLGDQSRAGWGWVAVVGFVLAVAGSLSLSRHGEAPDFASPQDMERTA
jgi:hypothetical protein